MMEAIRSSKTSFLTRSTSQKMAYFIVTAVKTSNLTRFICLWLWYINIPITVLHIFHHLVSHLKHFRNWTLPLSSGCNNNIQNYNSYTVLVGRPHSDVLKSASRTRDIPYVLRYWHMHCNNLTLKHPYIL
jgi:hypothetical protein